MVADDKVPEVGAQIKCPKCNNMFVVRKKDSTPPSVEQNQQSTDIGTLSGTSQPAPPSGVTEPAKEEEPLGTGAGEYDDIFGSPSSPSPPTQPPAPVKSKTAQMVRGVSAIRAQSVSSEASAAAAEMEVFKIRTVRGLAYDFSSREAMMRWLQDRDDLSGCEISEKGGPWVAAQKYVGGSDADAVDSAPSAKLGEALPMASFDSQIAKTNLQLPKAGVGLWVLVIFSFICVFGTAAATLTRFGVVDLSAYIPLQSMGINFPGGEQSRKPKNQLSKIEQQDPEIVFRKALGLGERSLKQKRFSKAVLEYKRALAVHPGSVVAWKGLAHAYNGLGDIQKATRALKKAKSLKAK
jgi:hypothetical protein